MDCAPANGGCSEPRSQAPIFVVTSVLQATKKLGSGLGTKLGYRRNVVADREFHSVNSYNDCSGFDKNLRLSLSRVDLTTTVTITSNPVVANDNRTGAIQVFVQGTDGQVNH